MKNPFRTISRMSIAVSLMLILLCISCAKNNNLTTPGKIFVANEDNETISVIDAGTNTEITQINIADGSGNMLMVHNVQVAPDGKTVWATAMSMTDSLPHELIVIDPNNYAILARVLIAPDIHLAHVVLDNDSRYAFATATDANKVYMVDAKSYTVIKSFAIGAGHSPHGMRYSNGKLYVANIDAKSLSIIDVSTGLITEIPLGGVAIQTAVTKDGKFVFISLYDTKQVARYDVASGTITKINLPACSQGPIQLYPTPDCQTLYVSDQGILLNRPSSNKVFVIDIPNASVRSTITVGNAAHGVVVNNFGSRVYVSNSGDNTVSVIDAITNRVLKVIPVGLSPNGIAYWYQTGGMP